MVTKKGNIVQSIHIAKTEDQWTKTTVAAFMKRKRCKRYSKEVWFTMSREQQIQVKKLWEQQGIKWATKQSAEAMNAAHEAHLGINSQPSKCDASHEEDTPKESPWGRNRGNPMVTCQALCAKCKEPGWLLGSWNGKTWVVLISIPDLVRSVKCSEKSCSSLN